MHKFHVVYNLGGGSRTIFADDIEQARHLALVEYRRNTTAIDYGLEKHTIDETIKSIDLVD